MSPPLAQLDPTQILWISAGLLLLSFSIYIQWCAVKASRLGRKGAPACFSAPPRNGAGRLVFLGDLQRGALDVVGPLATVLASEEADLLVSSGDLVSHGEAPYYGIVLAAVERAGIETPVRVVPGNHDLWPRRSKDDRIGGAEFERCFGPRHWAVRTGPLLVVGLDNGADWLIEDQIPWLRDTLDAHEGVPWICVCHRPPWCFDRPGAPVYADMEPLLPVLRERPPALVVSGHLHEYRDETVDGLRCIVNAHGGDVHGLGLRRDDFELLHVRVEGGELTVEPRKYRRKISLQAVRDQLAVRVWAERRKPLGAILGLPGALIFKLFGCYVPVVKHPVERRLPDKATLRRRRAAAS